MEKVEKRNPVIIELDELELRDVVGGSGEGGPELTPSRCPKHRQVDDVTVAGDGVA